MPWSCAGHPRPKGNRELRKVFAASPHGWDKPGHDVGRRNSSTIRPTEIKRFAGGY
jgi:hypothetical protein